MVSNLTSSTDISGTPEFGDGSQRSDSPSDRLVVAVATEDELEGSDRVVTISPRSPTTLKVIGAPIENDTICEKRTDEES